MSNPDFSADPGLGGGPLFSQITLTFGVLSGVH
jgi:hypothetical protein